MNVRQALITALSGVSNAYALVPPPTGPTTQGPSPTRRLATRRLRRARREPLRLVIRNPRTGRSRSLPVPLGRDDLSVVRGKEIASGPTRSRSSKPVLSALASPVRHVYRPVSLPAKNPRPAGAGRCLQPRCFWRAGRCRRTRGRRPWLASFLPYPCRCRPTTVRRSRRDKPW
jgi:hypothetical protein